MPSKHIEILYSLLKQIAEEFWNRGHNGAINDAYALCLEDYSDFEKDWRKWLNENNIQK